MGSRGRPRSRPWKGPQAPVYLRDLTERQFQVVELVARGLASKEIAQELGISPHTVKNHITLISEKLGLDPNRDLRVQMAKLFWMDLVLAERIRAWVEVVERGVPWERG